MRKVTYSCDLCREVKPHTEMKTVYYGNASHLNNFKSEFYLKDVEVNEPVDKQICNGCIEMIKKVEL